MKHIKRFNFVLNENAETSAERWVRSSEENADYDVVWKGMNDETVGASFIDPGFPVTTDNSGVGYSNFDMVPGTSTDGNTYLAKVIFAPEKNGKHEIESIGIEMVV